MIFSFISNKVMNFDNQNSNGLLRFRSAPSSVLQSFINDIEKTRDVNDGLNYNFISQSFQDLQEEVDLKPNLMAGFSLKSQLPPHYPRQSTSQASMDNTSSYSSGTQLSSTMAMSVDNLGQQSKTGSNLLRQNSSPAGLFSHLNHPNGTGYGGMGGTVTSYRLGNVGNNGELIPSSCGLKRQISSTSGVTSLGMLPRISEIEPENSEPGVLNESSDYTFGSWEHKPSQFIDSFSGLKRELDLQNGDNLGNHPPPMLAHHLSLPKTSGEMSAVEKILHFQDSVPCKIRAKRGCATHPRSIAERVRRTRISERMRKLQELVPNMDKQTNTSDMLDLAVDYIKDLQEQYKALKDCRANCRCSARSGQS